LSTAEALSRIAVSFNRAHATFEFDQVSRAREVLIPAASFSALEPMTNVLEKEDKVRDKEHDDLQEIAFELMPRCGRVNEIGFAWRIDVRRSAVRGRGPRSRRERKATLHGAGNTRP
jgi:hypothetical protein